MRKLFLLFIVFTTYIFANQSILIINSYHKGYEWSDLVVSGIEKSLYSHTNIDMNILYMDSKRITSKEYLENLKKLYSVQLKNRKYDLVITVDRSAYDFVLENYNEFFTNEKILTVGIENYDINNTKKYNLEDKVSALIEKRDLKANVRLIEQFIPTIKKLYLIDDNSVSSSHTQPLIKELKKSFSKEYELVHLKEHTLDDLQRRFYRYEENSAALFLRFYKNANGKLNKNHDISNIIKNSNVPVFVTDSIFYRSGATGGKIIDLYDFGKKSGAMALEVLDSNQTIIKTYDNLYYVLDASKLDQFALSIEQLPLPYSQYKLINKKKTFFDEYRTFIDAVFIISPLLVFLILGLLHNIYLKMKNASKLRQRIEFDSVLLNAIESPIFWQNSKGVIIESNAKFCNFIGLPAKDIYGKKLKDIKSNDNVLLVRKILARFKKDKEKHSQFRFRTTSNEKRSYYIKQAHYCDSKTKKTGVVTIFTDITKEKEIEKEREKNQEFIIQQSKLAEIGEIFSSIAHQWKSPLVEITTIAQESFYSSNSNLSEDESYVKDIMTQVNYMNNTINDFQNFIMPSNEKKVFDAKEAIDSTLEIVNHNIKYNYIDVKVDVEDNTNLEVFGFKNEFMQSILNIVNNAKDALKHNDLKNRKLLIHFFNDNNYLVIKIVDNAGGIQETNLRKIFKPYYSTKKEGHGIGLYMAKMIIEDKMNGKIIAKNIEDGASFEIVLENVK